jgi:hypothetical protein
MAEKNGDGIVYHRSDCGDANVRMYGGGGDCSGSICAPWGLSSEAIKYIHDHPEKNHRAEDIWAMEFNDVVLPVLKEGYEKVEAGVVDAYHWVDANACNIGVTAAITAAFVAVFEPEDPAGAEASTALSLMADPILYIADKAAKAAVVMEMTKILTDLLLEVPFVSDSVDHTLLTNIISNCLGESLKRPELWVTPAGVGIALGAAFAPVLADLICKKTCPEGFTKAFGA